MFVLYICELGTCFIWVKFLKTGSFEHKLPCLYYILLYYCSFLLLLLWHISIYSKVIDNPARVSHPHYY